MLGMLVVGALLSTGCAQQMAEEGPAIPQATRTIITVTALALPQLPHREVRGSLPGVDVADNRIVVGHRTVDVSPLRADSAVSTRGGVFFLNEGELWFLSRDGARATGFAGVSRVVVSADGRYLGLVDRNHGPAISGNAQVAAAVVYDTVTGHALVRSYAGMGRSSAQLGTTYAAHPPTVQRFDGAALVVDTPTGLRSYPF